MGRISFFLKEAFGSLRRNYFMTIAALVTVFLSIVVLGGVLVFVYTTEALLQGVEEKVEIKVFLKTKPDPSAEQITAMQTQILAWPEVKSCTFISKEDALDRMRDWFGEDSHALDDLASNPLPASFEIALVDPQMVDEVAARFDGDPIVDEVDYGEELADRLFAFTSEARNFLLVFIVLLGIVAILLISNTIRLSIFARKREVEIMKLVGATNWFIRWPFVIEGVTVGFFGAAAAVVAALTLTTYLKGKVHVTFVSAALNTVPYTRIALILLAVGVVIGAAGSAIGLRRFLKV